MMLLLYALLATAPAVTSIDTLDLRQAVAGDANLLLVDLRPAAAYEAGHLPTAVNYPWAPDSQAQSLKRLEAMFKLGPRNVVVYGAEALALSEAAEKIAALNGGRASIYPAGAAGWAQAGEFLEIEPRGLLALLTLDTPQVFDVRDEADFAAGHIPGALRFDPGQAAAPPEPFVAGLKKAGRPVVTYCGGGLCGESRRLAAALVKKGVRRVYQFPGGYPEWLELAACMAR